MKTLKDHTIYCTEEQTKKARELGASIEIKSIEEAPRDWQGKAYFTGMATCAKFSTAEQMLEWLRSRGFRFNIAEDDDKCFWQYRIGDWFKVGSCSSPREATHAAINAALEYLENSKQ